MPKKAKIVVQSASDIIDARAHSKLLAKSLAFEGAVLAAIATVVSDFAHHIVDVGTSGEICVERIKENGREGVKFTVCTSDSRIVHRLNLSQDADSNGHNSNRDLTRLKTFMDKLDIHSGDDGWTTVVMKKWIH